MTEVDLSAHGKLVSELWKSLNYTPTMDDLAGLVKMWLVQRMGRIYYEKVTLEQLIAHGINCILRTPEMVSLFEVMRSADGIQAAPPFPNQIPWKPAERPQVFRPVPHSEQKAETMRRNSLVFGATMSNGDHTMPFPPTIDQIAIIVHGLAFNILRMNSLLTNEDFEKAPWVLLTKEDEAIKLYPVEGDAAEGVKQGTGVDVKVARLLL